MASILVVDDDLSILTLTSEILTGAGHKVWRAGSAGEAQEALLRPTHFDLAIVDLVMPEMPGMDLIDWMRREAPSLPVIAMSGYVSPNSKGTIGDLQDRGVEKILFKPFDSEELLSAVTERLTG